MRRILHVITSLNVGGAERVLVQLCTAKGGWAEETTVVSLLSGGPLAEPLRQAGVNVVELSFRSPLGIAAGVWKLVATIRTFKPDIVQGWMYHGDLLAWLGLTLSRRRRKTGLIWSIRCANLDLSKYGVGLRIVVKLCAMLSNRPDVVTANSMAGIKAHAALGYHPRRTSVIYNGIDLARFQPIAQDRKRLREQFDIPADAFVVAHVARIDPAKDHQTFLDAMNRLPGIYGILVGLGTERLAGPQNLRCLGLRNDVQKIIPAADMIVSSSTSEGFPNVIGEAMACGLPAVATDVGDTSALVGDTGTLVPPNNPSALADEIRALASQPLPTRQALGARARARIESDFAFHTMQARFNALYDEVLSVSAPTSQKSKR